MKNIGKWVKNRLWILRAVIASNISAIVDFVASYLAFLFLPFVISSLISSDYNAAISAAIGAICGGITNFTINLKWTFADANGSKKAMIIKFFLIWLGSLLLNSGGTEIAYQYLSSVFEKSPILEDESPYAIARLGVSFIVSVGWNLPLQKYFVFR